MSNRKLTPAQATMLLRLRDAEGHAELTPGGNRKAALSAANWYRCGEGLVALGLAEWFPAGGGKRCQLTVAGIGKADELNAALQVKAEEPPPKMSDEEFQASLRKDVEEAEARLNRLEEESAGADARCMSTPLGDSDLQKYRDRSSRAMDDVEQARADLEKARADLKLFGR